MPSKDPTRPYRQFFYQVDREQIWIQDELEARHGMTGTRGLDIAEMAYSQVKSVWYLDGLP